MGRQKPKAPRQFVLLRAKDDEEDEEQQRPSKRRKQQAGRGRSSPEWKEGEVRAARPVALGGRHLDAAFVAEFPLAERNEALGGDAEAMEGRLAKAEESGGACLRLCLSLASAARGLYVVTCLLEEAAGGQEEPACVPLVGPRPFPSLATRPPSSLGASSAHPFNSPPCLPLPFLSSLLRLSLPSFVCPSSACPSVSPSFILPLPQPASRPYTHFFRFHLPAWPSLTHPSPCGSNFFRGALPSMESDSPVPSWTS